MTVQTPIDPAADRQEVLESVRPRLVDLTGGQDLEALLNAALDDLTPAAVTTYLPILVERHVRAHVGARVDSPAAQPV